MYKSRWSKEELEARVNSFPVQESGKSWYHKIDLGQGVITPGFNFEPLWDNIREVRRSIDYTDKIVLDIGSWDGMWAFEAEKLLAKIVIGTDVFYQNIEKTWFVRDVLNSNVIFYYNVSPYNLWERLDVFLQETDFGKNQKPYDRLFDIVQHLGVLYHLRDPMLSFSQARSVMKAGGYMVLETAAVLDSDDPIMLFNGDGISDLNFYETDWRSYWAPTIPCLLQMLRATLFAPQEETIHILSQQKVKNHEIGRVALVAKAMAPEELHPHRLDEIQRTYRNPGLICEYLSHQ